MKTITVVLFFLASSLAVNAQWQGTNPVYFTAGRVGIGTSNPQELLDVVGDARIASRLKLTVANAYNGGVYGVIGLATGVAGRNLVFYNYDGPVTELMTLNGTTGTMAINNGGLTVSGNVGIGTLNPNQKLTVNGTIYGKEVKVDLLVPVPDYVFDKSYALPTIYEVKSFIDQNKHLPEVPSAKEMEANGLNLGEMNMVLLRKVEELTLYMIDQKKAIDEQRLLIEGLQTKIESIKK